jgi:hypothetical protein
MSDDLVVSGGGSTAVAVDDLFVDAARLAVVEATTADWAARLGVIRRGLDGLHLPESDSQWDLGEHWSLESAARCLDQANDHAGRLRTSLFEAAERYGATERLIDGLWQLGASIGAPLLGFLTPGLIVGGLLAALGQAGGSAVAKGLGFDRTPLEAWLGEHRGLLSDPAFVRLVRMAADHADEFTAGALHVPLVAPLAAILNAPENATVALGVAGLFGVLGSRVLVEGPVTVKPTAGGRVVGPPSGVGELADRVPDAARGAQIRIERYGDADDARWIVYVGGTVDLGLVAADQPFDQTSNLHGVADDAGMAVMQVGATDSGAGDRAVREAMRQAGVQPGDPLLAVGYSGGGIIAANLAADPDLNAVGSINLGGPVASAPAQDGVPVLSIEHEEDLVPATGGAGHPSDELVTVTRSVIDADRRYEALLPAHELARYRETAALVDESEEERLVAFQSLVGEITGGGQAEQTDWVATRDLSSSMTGAR